MNHSASGADRRIDAVLASGAIWGPAVFIAAWVVGGRLLAGYDPIDDQISRLAALGASTSVLMNLGFIVSAIGALSAAWGLRTTLGPPAAVALALNGVATFGVTLNPLGGPSETGFLHAIFALLAYLTLSAIGPLSARVLSRRSRRLGVLAIIVGVVSLITLTLSVGESATGFFQRIGLSTTGIWLMGMGALALAGRAGTR